MSVAGEGLMHRSTHHGRLKRGINRKRACENEKRRPEELWWKWSPLATSFIVIVHTLPDLAGYIQLRFTTGFGCQDCGLASGRA